MNSSRKSNRAARSGASPLRRALPWLLSVAVLAGALSAVAYFNRGEAPTPVLGYEIVATYPHDATAYTQGLVLEGDQLYESTGHYGRSELRRLHPTTGSIEQAVRLSPDYFAEGIAIVGDEIIQLTWREGEAIVYDKHTLQEKRRHTYRGEGWGLAYDGQHLILSDGSSRLRFFDPASFREVRSVEVTADGQPLNQINELEMVEGLLYANVWYSNRIARIDPATGKVVSWIDLGTLEPQRAQNDAVLNGIAYDAQQNRLFVTGKLWPRLYEIRVKE